MPTPHHTHNNRQPQFLSNPGSTCTKTFVVGMNGCKKIRMGVLKRQTTKDQGSVDTPTPPPQEISFTYSFFLVYNPSSPNPPPHRGMKATIMQSLSGKNISLSRH